MRIGHGLNPHARVKRWRATEEDKEYDAKRPAVDLLAIAADSSDGVAAAEDFRGEILGRTTESLETVRGEILCQPKVGKLNIDIRPAVNNENVLRLELERCDNDGRGAVRNETSVLFIPQL